ncbi:MAG: glycosyl transferase group 1 [Actinomycetia bacterium]|nr:glycosyl transferase group 1 [Actinomycetes bacterium]
MKIALVETLSPRTADDSRGLERALTQAGHQVTAHSPVTGHDAGACDERDPRAAVPRIAASLRAQWHQARPDVVHATGWAAGVAALAAARELGIPVVESFGSLAITERRHGLVPQLERGRLERAIGLAASAIIAGSGEEAADLARLGVSRRLITVIPRGVDLDVFTPQGPAARRPARTAGQPRIVAVDVPDSAAGDEQSAILARAVAAVPGAELITGPGGREPRALRRLAELLRSADVFVHAAVHEPTGIACLRAMACGVPVVASAVGAHGDIVVEGTTGFLVPPGRPELVAARIRHLLGHSMPRQALSVAAVDRARSRYSWDRVAAETLAVYQGAAETQLVAA